MKEFFNDYLALLWHEVKELMTRKSILIILGIFFIIGIASLVWKPLLPLLFAFFLVLIILGIPIIASFVLLFALCIYAIFEFGVRADKYPIIKITVLIIMSLIIFIVNICLMWNNGVQESIISLGALFEEIIKTYR